MLTNGRMGGEMQKNDNVCNVNDNVIKQTLTIFLYEIVSALRSSKDMAIYGHFMSRIACSRKLLCKSQS